MSRPEEIVTRSREAATATTIKKINAAIAVRREHLYRYFENSDNAVTRNAIRGAIPEYVTDPQDIDMWNGTGPFAGLFKNRSLAETIARKRFTRKTFPQTFVEAGLTAPPNHRPETENAEVLYHFLTESFYVGDGPPIAMSLSSTEIADTDHDGLLEVVDAWGNPLRFYRWPTRMIRPQPQGDEATPQDDTGTPSDVTDEWFTYYSRFAPTLLVQPDPTLPPQRVVTDMEDELGFLIGARDQGVFTSAAFENNWHTIETWHAPLLVSAGEDGELGLFEPTDSANAGHLGQPRFRTALQPSKAMPDDISNWKLTSLGALH